jgi:low temperature requirement protein LtrA
MVIESRVRRGLRAEEPQSVTFVELFFDLVFVFAVTQVTLLTAHDLTPGGVLRSLLLFWLIWWAWTQFTWTLNPAVTTHAGVRAVTLFATGAAFAMAASVPLAFALEAAWFALPYVVVRALGLALQVKVELERPGVDHGGVIRWATLSLTGLAAVLVGAVLDPELRVWAWAAAIVLDLISAGMAGRQTEWDLNPAHLSERHGLFVIIAIGESLIVAGTAVAADERSLPLVVAATGALVVACLLWWTYFGWLKDALEHAIARVPPARLGAAARDAYSLAHFPLVCGIVGFAVAIEEIVAHPDEPAHPEVVAALGVGVALFVVSSAVSYRRLHGHTPLPRLAILAVMAPLLVVVAPLAPIWPLAVVAAALFAIVVIEQAFPAARGRRDPVHAASPT